MLYRRYFELVAMLAVGTVAFGCPDDSDPPGPADDSDAASDVGLGDSGLDSGGDDGQGDADEGGDALDAVDSGAADAADATGEDDTAAGDATDGVDTVDGSETTDASETGISDTPDTSDTSDTVDATIDVGPPVEPGAGELVITEFMADPAEKEDENGEWLEVHNPATATAYTLDLCKLKDEGSNSHVINDQDLTIGPGEYLTFANSSNPGFGSAPDYEYEADFQLANSVVGGDEIILECSGTTVDAVDYAAWDAYAPTPGAAEGLHPDKLDAEANDHVSNWYDQVSDQGNGDRGTPGEENDRPKTPGQGDIVVNEFMANPDEVADADGEWLELYNPSSETYDLGQCELRDDSGESHTITEEARAIGPGEHLTLARSDSPGWGYPPQYVYGDDFTLDDAGDQIVVECEGTVVDEVDYAAWSTNEPTAGVAEGLAPQKKDAAANDDADNWHDQLSDQGNGDRGTPGAENDPWKRPGAGDVVINEFMAAPSALEDAKGEWFEVYNAGDSAYVLDGCEIRDGGTDSHTVAEPTLTIAPGQHLTFARSSSPGFGSADYVYGGDVVLDDSADQIVFACEGTVVDEVDYAAWSNYQATPGAAEGLNPERLDATANDESYNWYDQLSDQGNGDLGTPGSENDRAETPGGGDLVVTEFMADPEKKDDVDGEWIEIHNPSSSTIFDLQRCDLKDRGSNHHLLIGIPAVEPGEYVTLARSSSPGFGAPDYVHGSDFVLSNSDDEIVVECDGTLVDEVDYSSWTGATTTGVAEGLDPNKTDATSNDDESNWCDQTSDQGNGDRGTPGAGNDAC